MYYNSSSSQAKICINGSWVAIGVPTVTSLPGSPANGDEVYYQFNRGDGTNAYWHLKYNSGTTYWDYLGGPPLYARVESGVTTTSSSYVSLTGGPSLTVPLQGDYDIGIGSRAYTSNTSTAALMSYQVGATAASDNDAIDSYAANSVDGLGSAAAPQQFRLNRQTGVSSGSAIAVRYKIGGAGTANFNHRWMEITPIRVK